MDLLHDRSAIWTVVIALGYPALAIGLVEVQRILRHRSVDGAKVCRLAQTTVLPPLAVYVLLDRVARVPAGGTFPKVVLSVLAITAINTTLVGFNAVMRSGAVSGDWAQRTTGLVMDLARMLVVLVVAAVVASHIWGVDLGSMLTALGVGSVVLGLALQDTLSGLFAGVSLLSSKHFKEGDWIEVGELSGRIVTMNWRTVTIETLDDERLVVIPNSELAGTQFTVLTTGTRTFGENIEVHFAYGTPPAKVMDALEKAVLSVDIVLPEPPHDIDLVGLDDKGVRYEITIHTRTRKQGEEAVTEVLRKLWYICQRESLTLAGAAHRLNGASEPLRPGPVERAEALAATELFPADATGIDRVVRNAHHELYDEGEVLLDVGDAFTRLYVVADGGLAVTVGHGEAERAVQQVEAGGFFITRAFLTGAPSGVRLRADGEVSVIRLDADTVLEFLTDNPTLARRAEEAIDLMEIGLSTMRRRG